MFKKIDPKSNLPEEENKVIDFWNENNIFQKTLEKASPKGDFVFFEGPPTANGQPGIHHVEARSFKDAFCRYKTMQGYFVKRKAGWDTHGLPVELQVEKELGISGKGQIENLVEGNKTESVTKFNELCKKSVWKYKAEWEKLTKRMGYWVDMTDPYVTYEPEYIESVWNIVSEINKKGLLYKGHKVVPYCPRCGTALSSHEVAQGYKNVQEESVYVKVKSTKEDVYFLVWTTTPWTLAGNCALAFGPGIRYVKVLANPLSLNGVSEGADTEYIKDHYFIVAKNRLDEVFEKTSVPFNPPQIIEEFSGQELIEKYSNGEKDYEPIYEEGLNFSEAGEKSYKLISADFVSDQDGTGIVHIAPAFGQDDYIWGYQKNGIKVLKTVDDKGTQLAGAGKGSFVKDADQEIKLDLEERNILFKKEPIKHDYPFCWRCDSPLLYFARDSWYIAMSKLRDELLKNNEEINWNPAYLKHGRFGNWLENLEDWAISRDRYWGTPLPVWECQKCDKYRVIGSFKEFEELTSCKVEDDLSVHKPKIDNTEIACECGGKMKRTPEVMDVWLDSGTMPFSQYHYPFENKDLFEQQFPADFICEAVDQTRGWFYTMLAVSSILKGTTPYKNVISVGHVLDDKGKKMSKSLGNIVLPMEAFNKYGADVIRYYFFSVNQPGEPKLFSDKEVVSISRNLFLTLWNVFTFFMTYASIDKFQPKGTMKLENVLDKWIVSKLNLLISETEKNLDTFDPYKPSNQIKDFVAELSTWYVRRSRKRFWKSENDSDKENAYETLYFVLINLSKILAPFAPMFSEVIYRNLRQESDPESVHLTDFPSAEKTDQKVLQGMITARKIVETGLSKRAELKIKVRQPLQSLYYGDTQLDAEFETIIAEEVNVKSVTFEKDMKETKLDVNITPELKMEGTARELIRSIQSLRKKSGFEVEDRIKVGYQTESDEIRKVFEKFGEIIGREILSKSIENQSLEVSKGQEDFNIDGQTVKVQIAKIKQL